MSLNGRSARAAFAACALCAVVVACVSAACTGPFDFNGLTMRPCHHREPPARPAVVGRGGTLNLVFALDSADFGNSLDDAGQPKYKGIGFDLDNTCTGEGQGSSCVEPPWATADHNDGVDGIDNASGAWAFGQNFEQGTPLIVHPNRSTGVAIVRVQDYSGDADDDQVRVSLYAGVQLSAGADGRTEPVWDGNDEWSIHPDTLVPSSDGGSPQYSVDRPRFVDDHGYVSGWVLVAHWPDALWMAGLTLAPYTLHPVHDVVMTARLVRVGQSWKLEDGVDDLRVNAIEYLPFLARYPTSPGSMEPVCLFPDEYRQMKNQFCSYVDIATYSADPSSPCDARTGAAEFTAKPVLIGGVAPRPAGLPDCGSNVHPDEESCDPSSNL
jgi:hypothetical protein